MTDKDVFPSETTRLNTGCGPLYLTLVFAKDKKTIIQVLPTMGKAGGCATAHLVALSREVTSIISMGNRGDRINLYTRLVGNKCHLGDLCCIELFARYLLEKELKLSEEERNEV